jgi:hypothetical protein
VALVIFEKEKPDSRSTVKELQVLIAWRLGKPCPSSLKLKPARLAYYLELKGADAMRPTFEAWTDADEEKLQELINSTGEGEISIDETYLGRLCTQRQDECTTSVGQMTAAQKEQLRAELDRAD